jgi:molybdopterin-guanine dinucleotide biosynthesis protein A
MTLSAILLAGGLSRRMGVDKATLLISGGQLWKRQLEVLNNLRPGAVWISARTAPSWGPAEIEVVTDKPPSRGPLSGIAAGLRRLQTSHLLVLAIDLPQMTAEHLRKLCVLAHPGAGVIPFHGDYFEPLCAIYPLEALAAAETALSSGDVSLQHFAQNLLRESQARVYDLASEERPLYLNMNTPSDLPESMGSSGQVVELI